MFKKIVLFLTICLSLYLTGCQNKKFYLSDKYYNNGEFIEVTKSDLESKNNETYLLYTYNDYCNFKIPCDQIFKEFMKKYKIDCLSISFKDFKNTNYYETIKYAPSIIIINNGKVIKYLDAEKDEDLQRYQDEEKFEEWLSNYIYFSKEG